MNPKSFRLSVLTQEQLQRLCEKLGMQQGVVLAIAIDRMAREELDYVSLKPSQEEYERYIDKLIEDGNAFASRDRSQASPTIKE